MSVYIISGIIITKHIVIIVINGTVSPDHDFPLGLVVGVSVAGVVIIATPIGAIIIVVIVVVRHKRKKKEKNEVIEEKVADKEDGENGDRKCSIFICCKGRETDGNVHDIICITAVYIHAVNYITIVNTFIYIYILVCF